MGKFDFSPKVITIGLSQKQSQNRTTNGNFLYILCFVKNHQCLNNGVRDFIQVLYKLMD